MPSTGAPGDIGRGTYGIRGPLSEMIRQDGPAMQQRWVGHVGDRIGSLEKRALDGVSAPDHEISELAQAVVAINDPGLKSRFGDAIVGAKVNAQFRKLSPGEIETVTSGLRAKMVESGTPTASAEYLAQTKALEKLHEIVVGKLKTDPIGWAEETGLIPPQIRITPDTFKPEILAARIMAANAVAQRHAQGLQVFTTNERKWMTEVMKVGGKPMEQMLGMMATVFGADTPHAMKEFAKSAPIAAQLGWLIARGGNAKVVTDLSLGIAKLQDEKHKSLAPNPGVAWTAAMGVMGSALSQQAGVAGDSQQAVIDAANILYDVRARAKGMKEQGANFDLDMWQQGLKEILGENKVGETTYGGVAGGGFWGGMQYIVPPNIAQDKVPTLLANLKISDIIGGYPVAPGAADIKTEAKTGKQYSGGGPETPPVVGSVDKFDGGTIGETAAAMRMQGTAPQSNDPVGSRGEPVSMATIRQAKLVTVGDGRYWLAMGDNNDQKFIKTFDGRNWELDLHKYESILRPRVRDAYRPN